MNKEFLTEYLRKKNYWWDSGEIDEGDKGIKRAEYVKAVFSAFGLERIVCLSGIRRAGKTTLLFQIMDSLLQKVEPKKIVYAKMDDLLEKIDGLQDIVGVYQELTGIDPKKEQVYFFFDEIHFLPKWQFQLKSFIDSKYKSKFIISGSSKTLLYKEASESLAGRIRFIDVFPLTFSEFLKFSGMELNIKKGLDFETVKYNYNELIPKKERILYLFNQYIEAGGFPEWFKIKNMKEWQKTLVEDYFSLILFKDIVHVFKIKDPILLEKLAKEVALFSTNRFSYLNLSNRLDIDRETIKLYLYYLSASGMIFISEVYFKTKKARERLEKKIYFWEEGLRKALCFENDDAKAAENIVAWHVIKRGLEEKPFFTPFYWKNIEEVDFIFEGKQLIPIEVKYREQPEKIKGLLEFMGGKKIEFGIVVTKNMLDRKKMDDKEILFIPVWLFLLVF